MRARMAPLAVSLLLSTTGCYNHDTGSTDESGVIGSGELENVVATINPVIPTVIDISWDAPAGGISHVEYGLEDATDKSTPLSGSDTHFSFNLLGLKAGHKVSFEAVTVTEDGTELRSETGSLTLEVQPQGLPPFVIDEKDTDLSAAFEGGDGYVMFSIMQLADSWVVIVDRDGDYVWYLEADDGLSIPSSHITPERDAIVYTQNDRMQQSDLGGIMRVTLAGDKLLTVSPGGHHDAIKLPGEDKIAYINVETDTFDVEDHGTLLVAYDNVFETPLGATDDSEADRDWSLSSRLSDYPRDPWYVCSHFNAEAYSTGGKDWTHSNSIMASDDGQYLYLMSKNLDALWKINRNTRAYEWQMGGEDSDFTFAGFNGTFADSPDHWSHAHMSDLSSDGLCLFDNGYHHDDDSTGGGTRSRVVEYSYDESTMEVSKTWEMWLADDYFNPELGDCRRMPNGNHLVSVTVAGYMFEAAQDQTVVWKLKTDEPNATLGRVTYLKDLYTLEQE